MKNETKGDVSIASKVLRELGSEERGGRLGQVSRKGCWLHQILLCRGDKVIIVEIGVGSISVETLC